MKGPVPPLCFPLVEIELSQPSVTGNEQCSEWDRVFSQVSCAIFNVSHWKKRNSVRKMNLAKSQKILQ